MDQDRTLVHTTKGPFKGENRSFKGENRPFKGENRSFKGGKSKLFVFKYNATPHYKYLRRERWKENSCRHMRQ